MHVLFITKEYRYLEEGSQQKELLSMLQEVTESLHVVVLTTKKYGFQNQKIDEKTWIYPTQSFFSFLYYFDGLSTIQKQVRWKGELFADVILSDDAQVSGWIGLKVAAQYGRAWMVNLHTYYWDADTSFIKLYKRFTTVPIETILSSAIRIISFSKRAAIYAESITTSEEEKNKIVTFPEIYTAKASAPTIDIQKLYPEFNFTILAYVQRGGEKLLTTLSMIKLLRKSYFKAGLVIATQHKPSAFMRAQVRLMKAGELVRFMIVEPESFPFLNANVYLYVNDGEEEDSMLMRAALMGSIPIIAAQSPVSVKVLQNKVSGLLIYSIHPMHIVTAIRKINETRGVRELFKVNAGRLQKDEIVPSRESLVNMLRQYLTFPFVESPSSMPQKDMHLFAHLIQQKKFFDPYIKKFEEIKNKYTKLK